MADPVAGQPPRRRLVGIDAARGLALLGMMAVHALVAFDAQGDPTLSYSVAAGRSAALFAVLAGVGISLTTGRRRVAGGREGRGAVVSLVVRALALGVIGLLLGQVSDASLATVILVYYAVLFLLAVPLLFLTTRSLVVIGLVAALVVPVLSHVIRGVASATLDGDPSLTSLVREPGVFLLDLLLTGTFPALPWMAYLCAGLVLGRLQLASRAVAGRMLVVGLVMAVVARLVSWLALGPLGGSDRLYAAARAGGTGEDTVSVLLAFGADGTTPTDTWWWLATAAPHTSTPLDMLHTTGTAIALIGLMLLLTDGASRSFAWISTVLKPLMAAGSMTLTLYTAHVLFLNSPLDVFGATTGYLFQVVAALSFALVWATYRGSGPLESVVTTLSRNARRAATSGSSDRAGGTGQAGGG